MILNFLSKIRFYIKTNFHEIFRFLLIGGTAFFIDLVVYYVLLLVIPMVYAKAVSFVSATIFTFVFNKLWTFKQNRFSKSEILRFILYYIFSMFINTSVNRMVFLVTGVKPLAFMMATGVCMVLNYFCLKYFVFQTATVTKAKQK